MKTSNKILTTFLSIIAVYFLVFALDLRLLGVHRDDRIFPELNTHLIPISDFKYVKLENISNLVISPASTDSYELEIKYSTDSTHYAYLSESMLKTFKPSYSGDTIVLQGSSEQKYQSGNWRITIPLATQTISSSNSKFSMEGFDSDSLNIALNNSELNGSQVSNIKRLNILARNNSKVNAYDKYLIDTLNITLEDSRANFNKPLKQLTGSVNKKSNLDVRHVDDIRIKKENGGKVDFR